MTFMTLKYLSLKALLDLSWMADFFTKLSLVTLKKSSTSSSKFLNNFIKKAFVLNNGCNTTYRLGMVWNGMKNGMEWNGNFGMEYGRCQNGMEWKISKME